jgi:drug/metabolite transporter (DMT)-like permease
MAESRKKGIICILMAAISFAAMNTFVKMSGDDIPFIVKTIFRNAIAAILAAGMILGENRRMRKDEANGKTEPYFGEPGKKRKVLGLLVLRSLFGTLGIICNFYAVTTINVADASMLNKLSPFFAIIFSAVFLKERPDRAQWLAVAIAFSGSLFIIKPSFSMSALSGLIGAMGGFGAGVAYTAVRQLGKERVRSSVIVLFFSLFSLAVVLPFAIYFYKPMTTHQFVLLLLSGVAAASGQIFITNAYRFAPAKEISVYDYSQILFAAILGYFLLEQVPDLYSVIGYVVICGVGVWMFLHNKKTGTVKSS